MNRAINVAFIVGLAIICAFEAYEIITVNAWAAQMHAQYDNVSK